MLALGTLFGESVQLASSETDLVALPAGQPDTNTSFASLKQIDAGLLNVGFAEDGPPDGPPVILLQGWPYDIFSYVDVAPLLATKGYTRLGPAAHATGGSSVFRSLRRQSKIEDFVFPSLVKNGICCALTRSIHVKANTVSARKRATRPRCAL